MSRSHLIPCTRSLLLFRAGQNLLMRWTGRRRRITAPWPCPYRQPSWSWVSTMRRVFYIVIAAFLQNQIRRCSHEAWRSFAWHHSTAVCPLAKLNSSGVLPWLMRLGWIRRTRVFTAVAKNKKMPSYPRVFSDSRAYGSLAWLLPFHVSPYEASTFGGSSYDLGEDCDR